MFDFDPANPEHNQKLHELSDEIERRLEKLGVYVRNTAFNVPQDDEGRSIGDPFFEVTGLIGSIAWQARVQDPEQDKMDDEFRGLASDVTEQQFQEIRRQAQKRRARGESLAEALDDPASEDDGQPEGDS